MASGNDESDRPEPEETEPAAPESEFGPALGGFGPSLNDFGPALGDFGPTPAAAAPGWSPAPGPQGPDVGWRPAGAPPQYRAPDAWTPTTGQYPVQYPTGQYPPVGHPADGNGMATGQFPPVESAGPAASAADVEQTVRIPPGGSQSVPGNAQQAAPGGDQAAAEANSPGANAGGAAAGAGNGMAGAGNAAGAPDSWWRSAPSGFPPTPPESDAPQGESLSWADDPIVKALTPPKTPLPQAKPEEPRSWRKVAAIGAGAAVLVLVIGLVALAVMRGGKDDAPTAGATTTGKAAVSPTAAALSCPARRDGALTIGNGEGGTGSGVDAILGFEHAFYVERSGVKARGFVVPDSTTVMPADVIQQKGIDPLKPGTTYCLKIVETGKSPDQVQTFHDVDITEHRADGTTEVYTERVTTVERDGRHLIQSIE
ncbi:hypothetical protein D7D52_15530 [Nocardia yunnanensis]|uniref:DUF8176 domain-containing protein n=1 Tax=Nocardia yunnanensis TaxID=2382165 RepID=A0A386ZBK4_9NOCA|nr:hypothetical protein [Nocardia yunnanensis]AYF75041.1 hypothetical protein D7D52_15530 [Nocardia yunnanensis]